MASRPLQGPRHLRAVVPAHWRAIGARRSPVERRRADTASAARRAFEEGGPNLPCELVRSPRSGLTAIVKAPSGLRTIAAASRRRAPIGPFLAGRAPVCVKTRRPPVPRGRPHLSVRCVVTARRDQAGGLIVAQEHWRQAVGQARMASPCANRPCQRVAPLLAARRCPSKAGRWRCGGRNDSFQGAITPTMPAVTRSTYRRPAVPVRALGSELGHARPARRASQLGPQRTALPPSSPALCKSSGLSTSIAIGAGQDVDAGSRRGVAPSRCGPPPPLDGPAIRIELSGGANIHAGRPVR